MRVLITGATGLVGNNCLRHLHAQTSDPKNAKTKHELHVLVRAGYDERPFADLQPAPQCHLGDLSKPAALDAVLAPLLPTMDAVIHSAGDTHIGKQPRPMQWTINVDATEKLAMLSRQHDCRFIFVSSVDALPAGSPEQFVDETSVEGHSGAAKYPCGYVETKRAAEVAVLSEIEKGLDGFIVNPGFMLGPWDWKPSSGRMLLEVAKKFTPFGPWGGYSVCDIGEVAAAICRLTTDGSQVASHRRYILAGNNIRYIDAWRVFAEVSGGSKPICPAGPLMKVAAGRWGDWMSKLTGKEGDVNSAGIAMSNLFHYYDSSRAERELGYRIPPVKKSAQAAWDWFREHGYA